ncbi:MAG: 4-alpha-glucanotransferase [Bdellovibrionales bacterium RIFOXYD1_FULL_53_11]|nr:MAG: 4-alpha-glucanotransferase [Bdellovibrionales bacterium RIFOXYD1_FULL_53_11]
MTHSKKSIDALKKLAEAHGLQTGYNSAFGTMVESPSEGIVSILGAMGVEVKPDLSNIEELQQAQVLESWRQILEPVSVVWEGSAPRIPVRLTGALRREKAELTIDLEKDAGSFKVPVNIQKLPVKKRAVFGPEEYSLSYITFNKKLPFGYHKATLRIGPEVLASSMIISAPRKAYNPQPPAVAARSCGMFAPLYALHSKESLGIGDFSDLDASMNWAYSLGCDFVGTLPMLAIYTDKPMVEPSPYSPVSRIFWNELYADPRRSDEWAQCDAARNAANSVSFAVRSRDLQAVHEVDYHGVARLKRETMQVLADYFFLGRGDESEEFKKFLQVQPSATDYSEFRAACDHTNKIWQEWPDRMRDGILQSGDYDERDKRYHLYGQWLVHKQLGGLSEKYGTEGKRGLYLDFPLSVNASGYDAWRERSAFAHSATAGCPPDPVHVLGQNWGILPLNPKTSRETHYKYFRMCLENHMRYTGLLRLDHVMCFYRLYWVPKGQTAKEGVYVRYNMEEFFAMLALESVRNKCMLIGEDLGTVPPEIRSAMQKHGILRMYCQQRRASAADAKKLFKDIPPNCICSLNTHDMPPFASFFQGLDIEDKMKLGYFKPEDLPKKKKDREKSIKVLISFLKRKKLLKPRFTLFDVLRAMLLLTAGGPAKLMQVNAEDLWLETLPQNTPGTWKERPNWKRKLQYGLEALQEIKGVRGIFEEVMTLRKGKRKF